MIKLSTKGGGSYRPVLGKPACPFLLKNSVIGSRVSKRRVRKISGGGYCARTSLDNWIKSCEDAEFYEIFLGSGFCDG